MTLNWSYKSGGVTGSDITSSQNLIISEINENDPIPYISNILGDTCPPNYNHQITIYGQNFRPDSTVNIPGASNIATTIISPTEIVAQFTSGAIIGAFDIEVKNSDRSSILWGQNNKLNIINATGETLPLLDTWIDCRIGGSSDAMIGQVLKDTSSTWTRGIFGYSLTTLSSLASNWLFFFRLSDYSFPFDLPLKLELITYNSSFFTNWRWGLHLKSDHLIPAPCGNNIVPSPSYFYTQIGYNAAPKYFSLTRYEAPSFELNKYVKIIFTQDYLGVFNCDISDFSTTTKIKELFIPKVNSDEAIATYRYNGFNYFEPGLKFYPGGSNPSNCSHLRAFKLSWA